MSDFEMMAVQRVARAIWEKATPLKRGPWNDALQLWDRASPDEQRLCRLQAQAAISEIRSLIDAYLEPETENPK